MRRTIRCAVVALWCAFLSACGSKVSGHTYHDNGGVVQVEFKSGGKPYVSAPESRSTSQQSGLIAASTPSQLPEPYFTGHESTSA